MPESGQALGQAALRSSNGRDRQTFCAALGQTFSPPIKSGGLAVPMALFSHPAKVAFATSAWSEIFELDAGDCCSCTEPKLCRLSGKETGSDCCPIKRSFETREQLITLAEFDERILLLHWIPVGLELLLQVAEDVTYQRQLAEFQDRAEKALTAEMLARGYIHDINNALHNIGTAAQRLCQQLESGSAASLGQIILKASSRASDMAKMYLGLMLGQAESDQVVDLAAFLEELVPALQVGLGRQINIMMRQYHPAKVRINPSKLERVITNLTFNAQDAMPAGTIEINMLVVDLKNHSRQNRLAVLTDGRYAVIQVKDRGAGIQPDRLERIFDPFFTTKGDQGNGLGLSTSLQFIREAAGQIDVASEPGQGSTFSVYLPLHV